MLQKILSYISISIFICSTSFAQSINESSVENKATNNAEQTNNNPQILPPISPDDAPIKDLTINKSKIVSGDLANSIGTILLNKKTTSLMFDDDQVSNIDRAVDAFKNNQQFTPEMSDEEMAAQALKDKTNKENLKAKEEAENEKSFIYLASIIYFNSKDWTVWINNQKIKAVTNTPTKELYLESVKNDSIKVRWRISLSKWKILSGKRSDADAPNLNENNQVEFVFDLKPNQTFSLNSAKVIEGRPAAAILKKKEDSATSSQSSDSLFPSFK